MYKFSFISFRLRFCWCIADLKKKCMKFVLTFAIMEMKYFGWYWKEFQMDFYNSGCLYLLRYITLSLFAYMSVLKTLPCLELFYWYKVLCSCSISDHIATLTLWPQLTLSWVMVFLLQTHSVFKARFEQQVCSSSHEPRRRGVWVKDIFLLFTQSLISHVPVAHLK